MTEIKYEFDESKSKKLRQDRGLGFEEIITLIEDGYVVKTYPHPHAQRHPGQKVIAVNAEGYIWLVIAERRENKLRLVTLYQSRKETKKWLKESEYDETQF